MDSPEDKKQDITIAVMANDINYIKKSIEKIEKHLTDLDGAYLRKEDAERLMREGDKIHQDHELRIRRVERWGATAVGALGIIQFILNYFK